MNWRRKTTVWRGETLGLTLQDQNMGTRMENSVPGARFILTWLLLVSPWKYTVEDRTVSLSLPIRVQLKRLRYVARTWYRMELGTQTKEPVPSLSSSWNHFKMAQWNSQREVRVAVQRDDEPDFVLKIHILSYFSYPGEKNEKKISGRQEWNAAHLSDKCSYHLVQLTETLGGGLG